MKNHQITMHKLAIVPNQQADLGNNHVQKPKAPLQLSMSRFIAQSWCGKATKTLIIEPLHSKNTLTTPLAWCGGGWGLARLSLAFPPHFPSPVIRFTSFFSEPDFFDLDCFRAGYFLERVLFFKQKPQQCIVKHEIC